GVLARLSQGADLLESSGRLRADFGWRFLHLSEMVARRFLNEVGKSMANHRLDAAPETVHWGFFDAALKPLLTVDSGETVPISTVSGMASQMPAAPLTVPPALAAIHKS